MAENNKLLSIIYQLKLKLDSQCPEKFKWVSFVKSILDDCGVSLIWDDKIPMNRLVLKNLISRQLNDQFIQRWFS